jgi:uncharacterized membrane protein YphA (DoxX/SURF4 family)
VNSSLTRHSIPLLRWTLGLAVILESWQFAFSSSAAHFFAKTGLPLWLRPALGGMEIIAAVLFLIPPTARGGAYSLLLIFAFAALIHLLHGQFGVEALVVYAAAVFVCVADGAEKAVEVRPN